MYTYNATVLDVYDGDTVTVEIDLGFTHSFVDKLRLYGINTPEMRGDEKAKGKIVRDIVRDKILGKKITIRTYKDSKGKYGRYLADVFLEDGTNLNLWLVAEGYAEVYN